MFEDNAVVEFVETYKYFVLTLKNHIHRTTFNNRIFLET